MSRVINATKFLRTEELPYVDVVGKTHTEDHPGLPKDKKKKGSWIMMRNSILINQEDGAGLEWSSINKDGVPGNVENRD